MNTGYFLVKKVKQYLPVIVFGVFLFNCALQAQDMKDHQMNDSTMAKKHQMIHKKSSMVMSFDMDKVTHYFVKTEDGGNLSLRVKDPKDTAQVGLIRKHLKKEQALFSKADFRDPKTLHGKNMPGLKKLSQSKGKFNVDYKELSDGARLIFTSKDKDVVSAIHTWFDAQLKDHGSDAKSHE
ncbi:MAG: hypothetical protein ACM34K_09910 [Bacillota bacterium]